MHALQIKGLKSKFNHVNNQAFIRYHIIYHLGLRLIASATVQWTCWCTQTQKEQAAPSKISRPQCCFYNAWGSILCGFCERGLAALGPYQVFLPTSSPFEEICVFRSIRASGKTFTVQITGPLLFRAAWQSHKSCAFPFLGRFRVIAGADWCPGRRPCRRSAWCQEHVHMLWRHQVLLKGSSGFQVPSFNRRMIWDVHSCPLLLWEGRVYPSTFTTADAQTLMLVGVNFWSFIDWTSWAMEFKFRRAYNPNTWHLGTFPQIMLLYLPCCDLIWAAPDGVPTCFLKIWFM